MNLELTTLLGTKVNTQVYEVILPTHDGEIAVFPGHEPLVTLAVPGAIAVRRKRGQQDLDYYAITGGVIEINQRRVLVLVDEAEHGDDIIEAETKSALDRALELRAKATSQIELEKAHQLVEHHAARLRVADLHRRRRRP